MRFPGEVLAVQQLSAGYGPRRVLRELTLPPILQGDVTALVGPNGAGKSTLLRVLAGLLPAEGKVVFGDRDLLRMTVAERARSVSFMPQALPQRVALTVLEGVIAALRTVPPTNGVPGRGDRVTRQAIAVLERMGIVDLAHEPLDHLSGGQRQLASLAQSIVLDPAILLLDEPTSALDLRHQLIVLDLVRQFAAGGRIVVLVVHDLSLAARWSEHVIVLDKGHLESAGSPHDALTPSLLARVYGVTARVEPCTQGRLQVLVDGVTPRPGEAAVHAAM